MPSPTPRTILFHKPYGVLPCFTDPNGRATLADYISVPGVYAAGRLDRDSEGLMLLTADGALAHRLTDPRHKIPKVYWVQVERIPDHVALDKLRHGVELSGRRTKPAEARVLTPAPALSERSVPIRVRLTVPTAWLEIVLYEGMNRQVRRMTAAVGHPTVQLLQTTIGPLKLGNLPVGAWRALTSTEEAALKRSSA